MKTRLIFLAITLSLALTPCAFGQFTNALPGRTLIKLLPDYARPLVYGLNQANGSVPGTLVALNASNGVIVNEITLDLNPTDMAMTPAGDAVYVINAGSRTISKVDLSSFAVVSEQAISTPNTYSLSNPLYLVVSPSGLIYYTDGAWGPEIYAFDFNAGTNLLVLNTGGNQSSGAGGMVLDRGGDTLFIWQQYGWSAGLDNSSIASLAVGTGSLTTTATGPSQSRDPLNTPIFMDGAGRWVFNKVQMVSATNVTVLLSQFADNIYAISLDGSVAFGPNEVYKSQTGSLLTNLPFSTTVQALSGDQQKLFRYNSTATNLVVYAMAGIASVSGPILVPTPANGSVVSPPVTNLAWTVSPLALAYDVYLGTNQAQVAAATTSSNQYLGRVTSPNQELATALIPGTTYFWRVDVDGFAATNTGIVWSFTVATLAINPSQINISSIAGYSPASMTLNLTSGSPVAWCAAVTGSNWMTLNPTNGTTPSLPALTFNTTNLAAGQYSNNVEFTIGSYKLELPVALTVLPLNIVKMVADNQRPYIYALQPPLLSGQNGLLLFINTATGNIDKTLPIGINPVDLSINYGEGNLYIASWGETWTYVVNLNTQTLLPSLNLGTDVYKISAGMAGWVITEGENQWVYASLIDTVNGSVAASAFVRAGDGKYDPTGTVYYHCDDDISDACVHKYMTTNSAFTEVADSNQHPYGTCNLVLSADGSRLFWNSYAYDPSLNELGTLGAEIYSCSTNGRIAFSASQAFDSTTRLAIFNLPVSSSVSIVDGQNQCFWYYNSATATLGTVPISLVESPSFTVQPPHATSVSAGGSAYLTATAIGLAPLSYQWTAFGTNLPGATNYFLSLTNMQPAQQGGYQLVVSNAVGAVTSSVAQVTVFVTPTILSLTPGTNVLAGQPINLTVGVAGSSPLIYRWMFQNTAIAGATNSTLTITNAQPPNEGIYCVVVTNVAGSATSAVVDVRVSPSAPIIVTGPASITLPASSNALFGVTAIGSQPLSCNWLFDNLPLAGAASSVLVLTNIQSSNGGSYQVVLSNSVGSITSAVATLTVTPLAPYFTLQPVGASNSAGTSRTFTCLANGSQPIYYQWQQNNTNIPGATQTSLLLAGLNPGNAGSYTVIATNSAGSYTSAVAQLTIFQAPTITMPLTNVVTDMSNTVVLSVAALGSATLNYTWRFNGALLAATSSVLTLTNIQTCQSGFYQVTVTNQYGSAASLARVSVYPFPSQVIAWGDNSGGQCSVPANLIDAVGVAGGDYHTIALRHNGTLLGWGYNGNGQTNVPAGSLPYVSIASGAAHNLAIRADGSLVAWGFNNAGQTNIPANAKSNVLSIAAGNSHSLALLSSGSVVAWGDNSFGQTSVPAGLTGVVAIAAGRNHSLALLGTGHVSAWGFNAYGQATPPAGLTNAIAIAGGYLHSAALCSNGAVVVWGDDSYGQTNVPAGLSNVVAIAAGDFHTLALRADGTILAWGDDSYGQLDVPAAAASASGISSGNYHSLALVPAVVLQIGLRSSQLILNWEGPGVLQWAPTPLGPWASVNCQGNCYTNLDMSCPAKFFRVQH
jgi:alpha-tubulin suppressor-like RCC1 family protein